MDIKIKPILSTPTLDAEDSERILSSITKPISSETKDKLKKRRELILKTRRRTL